MDLRPSKLSGILQSIFGLDTPPSCAHLLDNGDVVQGVHNQPLPSRQKPQWFEGAVETRMVHVFRPGSAVRYTRHKGDEMHVGVVVACTRKGYLVQHGRHKKNRSRVSFVEVVGKDGSPSYRYEAE